MADYVFDGPDEVLDLPALPETSLTRGPQLAATLRAVTLDGPWAQFGVYRGYTAQVLLRGLPAKGRLELFDSFEGLPEDWHKGTSIVAAGTYACEPPLFSDPRVEIVRGLFCDVLPRPGPPYALIDIDCDLYSSACDVLWGCDHRIVCGTVLRFDDLFAYPAWRNGEYRALQEWLEEKGRTIEWLSRGPVYWATCRVLE